MIDDFPSIVRVRFVLETTEPARLPAYAGSAWRGLLGHSLRRTVCVTRQPTCDGCLLAGTCAYSVFFESPPPTPDSAQRYTALPHPFVLDVDATAERDIGAGAALHLGMNLIGPATDLLPYLIQTMDRAGARGIGRARGRFALREVTAEQELGSDEWQRVYDAGSGTYQRITGDHSVDLPRPPEAVSVLFQTPLRIKRRGRFIGAGDFAVEDFLRHLHARLSDLSRFYGGVAREWRWPQAGTSAGTPRLRRSELAWSDWTRFSSRQNTAMQMGGLVGRIVLEGPGLAPCWPALWMGQWTHVGKGTSFGLGKYRLGALDATKPSPDGSDTGSRDNRNLAGAAGSPPTAQTAFPSPGT